MTRRVILPRKAVAEVLEVLFGFQDQMPFGAVISGANISVVVSSGEDPAPLDMLSGNPSLVDDYFIHQDIVGGLPGVIYLLTCTVAVSGGLQLSKQSYLAVTDPAQEF